LTVTLNEHDDDAPVISEALAVTAKVPSSSLVALGMVMVTQSLAVALGNVTTA
jgi:hypothetical protein